MSMSPIVLALVGGLLAAWLVLACWAILSGLSMRRAARQAHHQTTRLGMLLQSAPAGFRCWCGRTGASKPPSGWPAGSGRAELPAYLSELLAEDGGLEPEHAKALAADIKAGTAWRQALRAAGCVRWDRNRTLLVRGGPADRELASLGAIVLWLFDATESQSRIEDLRGQVARYRDALEALSGVIEAAPMPVWHRTPDQQASASSTALCPCRGCQDRPAGDRAGASSLSRASTASRRARTQPSWPDAQAPSSRMVPVTVDGERRLMRVVDVPLGPAGVAGLCHRHARAGAGARRAQASQPGQSRHARPAVGRRRAIRVGSEAAILQPAVSQHLRAQAGHGLGRYRFRPGAGRHARRGPCSRDGRFPGLAQGAARMVHSPQRHGGELAAARWRALARLCPAAARWRGSC